MNKGDIKKTILESSDLLDKYEVLSIALFGSFVRNEQNDNSDIDLLVEFKNNTYKNFINLIFELESIFQRKVQILSENSLSKYIKPYILKEAEIIERR